MKLKQTLLILSSLLILSIALCYGVSPQWFVQTFLGMADINSNFVHILRAIMGLYIAFGVFWFFSAFSVKHRNPALLSIIIFAGGLFVGRVLSTVVDGLQSDLLTFYMCLELVVVPVTYWVYRLPE